MRTTWTPELDACLIHIGDMKDALKNGWDTAAKEFNRINGTTLKGDSCKQRYNQLIRKKNANRDS